jgi:hypothetical protein
MYALLAIWSVGLAIRVWWTKALAHNCHCPTALMLAERHWSSDLTNEVAELKDCFKDVSVELERPAPQFLYHYTGWATLCKMLQARVFACTM